MRKILTIDGGGIKGVFPAAFLAALEEQFGTPITRYFDLIAGTSTGGIIALALGAGLTAREVQRFYEECGPTIFAGRRWRLWRSVWMSKYDPTPLKDALAAVFQNKRLGESRVRLLVPSANLETGEVHLFKTAHHVRLRTDYRALMVDIAMATAAAPSYFPTHTSDSGIPLVDGGVWANNPVGFAVVEALSMLGWESGSFDVLSVGCTCEPIRAGAAIRKSMGNLYWARKAADLFLKTQSSASLGIAQHLAGHEHVARINPTVANGRFALDAAEEIRHLCGLGASEARKAAPHLERFFNEVADPFSPYAVCPEE